MTSTGKSLSLIRGLSLVASSLTLSCLAMSSWRGSGACQYCHPDRVRKTEGCLLLISDACVCLPSSCDKQPTILHCFVQNTQPLVTNLGEVIDSKSMQLAEAMLCYSCWLYIVYIQFACMIGLGCANGNQIASSNRLHPLKSLCVV